MVRSSESLVTGTDEAGAEEVGTAARVDGKFVPPGVVARVLGFSGVAVEVAAGLLGCKFAGGFGAKYFVQPKNTIIDSSEATRMRISGVNLSFFPPLGGRGVNGGVLKSPPCVSQNYFRDSYAWFPISPEPDHSQIFAIVAGSVASASCLARFLARRQSVQSLRTHTGNRSAETGSFLKTAATGKTYRNVRQTKPRARQHCAYFAGHGLNDLLTTSQIVHQAQQLRP